MRYVYELRYHKGYILTMIQHCIKTVISAALLFLIPIACDNEETTTVNTITPSDVAQMNEVDRIQHERWQERTEHWNNVNAFAQHIIQINEDKVVESSESLFICGVVTQWVRQLEAAQVYAQEWQRDYYEEGSLAALEEYAESGYTLAIGFQTDCEQLQ